MGRILRKTGLTAAMALMVTCAYGQFQPTTPLPRALLSHTAVTLNGRIYVAGGLGAQTGSGYLNNVYYCAQIMPGGQLGAWQDASPMPEFLGLGMHAAAAHNGRLYVLGGTNLYGPRNITYFSEVNEDGTLAGWRRTTTLPQRFYAHSAAVYGERIYITGGLNLVSAATNASYSAAINADGSLGYWRQEKILPLPLFGHRSFASGGKLFVLGGFESASLYGPAGAPVSGPSSAVYAATINPDGTLGDWQAQPPLPSGLAFYGLAVSDNSVYLLGGFDGGTSNAVYFAPFNSEGGLGSWVALQALPRGLLSLAAVSNGDYLYSIGGGLSYIDDPVADINFSSLKTDLKAFIRLTPSSINKKSNGKWVTVIVGLPEADAAGVVPDSVKISGINGEDVAPIDPDPKWTSKLYTGASADFDGLEGVTYLMLKFGRQAVADIIPEGEFSIRVEGRLADGRVFTGESMNRALSSKRTITAVLQNREGMREGPGGVKVNIPKGAFKGNPELLLRAAPEEEEAATPAEKVRRTKGMKDHGLSAASAPYEFGPHGMAFEKPLTISLPYNPENLPAGAEESALKLAYWDADKGEWEILRSAVSKADKLVSADVAHFSLYQVIIEAVPSADPAPAAEFALGEVYVYPNPARPGETPKLHITVPSGDKASVKVFSASGRKAYETAVSGAPVPVGGTTAYELDLRGQFPSGVYYFSAEVSSGAKKIKKAGKFAVLR